VGLGGSRWVEFPIRSLISIVCCSLVHKNLQSLIFAIAMQFAMFRLCVDFFKKNKTSQRRDAETQRKSGGHRYFAFLCCCFSSLSLFVGVAASNGLVFIFFHHFKHSSTFNLSIAMQFIYYIPVFLNYVMNTCVIGIFF
jgi:hypothetical protein